MEVTLARKPAIESFLGLQAKVMKGEKDISILFEDEIDMKQQ